MKALLPSILIIGLVIFSTNSCEDKDQDGFTEGYLTGTFLCSKVEDGHPVDTIRGFCISLDSENPNSNFPMSHFALSLPVDSLKSSSEIFKYKYNGSNCGPKFFPDSVKSNYKFMFKFRKSFGNEIIKFVCGPCTAMEMSFPWSQYDQITIEEIRICPR
jgi:hypothetical protein